jgi:uncharacterized membrane protein (DUF373 family)
VLLLASRNRTALGGPLPSLAERQQPGTHPVRRWVVTGLSLVEDGVYVGLGVLLTLVAVALLVSALKSAGFALWGRNLGSQAVGLLDQILLVLLIIELLYTVQVSFREHGLLAEPFLLVALIAVIRRVLVLTAEIPKLPEAAEPVFRHSIFELGLLTVMILVLVGSFVLLQRSAKRSTPQ